VNLAEIAILPNRQVQPDGVSSMSMRLPTPFLLLAVVLAACTSITPPSSMPEKERPMNVEQLKQSLVGDWTSIAPEIRPSAARSPDGTLKPFYLKREFTYLGNDRFQLTVVNSADPYAKVPLAKILIRGHMLWRGEHPIAPGAQKVDFLADEAYEVTPLVQGFADVLNKVASAGYAPWVVNSPQSIFGKAFAPFALKEGTNFMEYDLVYLRGDLLFWGARNIDGRGFDTEQNRRTNLQIPLVRK
jgi:hypothetical protein